MVEQLKYSGRSNARVHHPGRKVICRLAAQLHYRLSCKDPAQLMQNEVGIGDVEIMCISAKYLHCSTLRLPIFEARVNGDQFPSSVSGR